MPIDLAMINNLLDKIDLKPTGHIRDQHMNEGIGGVVWWETEDKQEKLSLIYLNTGESQYIYDAPKAYGKGRFNLDNTPDYFIYMVEKMKFQPYKIWTIPNQHHLH